jgi:hypothetical protein
VTRISPALFLRRVLDRVVALGVEAEQIPRLLHMQRQRRGDVDGAAARVPMSMIR